eukprot:169594_1
MLPLMFANSTQNHNIMSKTLEAKDYFQTYKSASHDIKDVVTGYIKSLLKLDESIPKLINYIIVSFYNPTPTVELVERIKYVEDDKGNLHMIWCKENIPPTPRYCSLKPSCLYGPDGPSRGKRQRPDYPVLKFNNCTYWPYSDNNNLTMIIVAYNEKNEMVKTWRRNGARYIWKITVDGMKNEVTFWGQSNKTITMTWTELCDFSPVCKTNVYNGFGLIQKNITNILVFGYIRTLKVPFMLYINIWLHSNIIDLCHLFYAPVTQQWLHLWDDNTIASSKCNQISIFNINKPEMRKINIRNYLQNNKKYTYSSCQMYSSFHNLPKWIKQDEMFQTSDSNPTDNYGLVMSFGGDKHSFDNPTKNHFDLILYSQS